MPNPKDTVRLQHMLEAAQKAAALVGDRTREVVEEDERNVMSILWLLEVLGEAARHISPDVREAHCGIPWQQIIGTRDKLIHGYVDIDLDIVWGILTEDLPPLIAQLEQIILPDTPPST
jgi:uncharacterized protein with HEPN domain